MGDNSSIRPVRPPSRRNEKCECNTNKNEMTKNQKNEKEKPVPKESRGPFFKSIFEKLEGILKEPE